MNPQGDTDQKLYERAKKTESELQKWRSEEKPASGAPVRRVPRRPAPAGASGGGRGDKKEAGVPVNAASEPPKARPSVRQAPPDAERMVTIQLPPFIKTILIAILGFGMCGALAFAGIKLLPRMGVNLFPSAPQTDAPVEALPTMDPLATIDPNATPLTTSVPTADPNYTLDPNATLDPNVTPDPAAAPDPDRPVCETAQARVFARDMDGAAVHVIEFRTDDGNIFIEKLNESFPVVNGAARVVIDDSEWFESNPANDASFKVEIRPVLTKLNGEVRTLSDIVYDVDVPASPLEIIQPASGYEEVLISLYSLQMRVKPGSAVTVNGNDVSDFIDRRGYISLNQTVKPIGDNIINVIVRTPSHRETRAQITLYRPVFDIPLELDINTVESTSTSRIVISGKFEPGASVSISPKPVDSQIDHAQGTFRFDMNLTRIGDNEIKITASSPGKESSVITHSVYYLPTEAEYSSKAWKMDYHGLMEYYEVWRGRIFLCTGEITEILPSPTPDPNAAGGNAPQTAAQTFVQDVGKDSEQLVYIDNYSATTVEAGKKYKIFADAAGLKNGCPHLIARYIYADD